MSQTVADSVCSMEERGERLERVVDIYESVDAIRGGDTGQGRRFRLTAVFVVLLWLFLLAVVITLWVKFEIQTEQKNRLQQSYNNLTAEKNEIEASYCNVTLQKNRLQTRFDNLTAEKKQLQSEFTNLTNEINQLRIFKSAMENGWKYFDFSIYYFSTGMRNWNESRQDCVRTGADLVVINSDEERKFITQYVKSSEAWIGLSDPAEKGEWKWVDGTTMPTSYWSAGEPNYAGVENCATIYGSSIGLCNNLRCSVDLQWICEKSAFS